jgi:uncharacterized SAM-binding protein YcdF (DUF218 family)
MVMFFILTKIVGLLIEPILHSLYLVSGAVILRLFRRHQLASLCLYASVLLPVLYSITPISAAFLRPLENHAPQISSAQLGPVDGIIVLGGHTKSGLSHKNAPKHKLAAQLSGSSQRLRLQIDIQMQMSGLPAYLGLSSTKGGVKLTQSVLYSASLARISHAFSLRNVAQYCTEWLNDVCSSATLLRPTMGPRDISISYATC